MKLLQINVTANWGSHGRIAEGIGQEAMARGWDSTIAYGRYMNSSQSRLIRVGTQFDVYTHYARHRFLDGEGFGSKKATLRLLAEIDLLAPDIIQLHIIHGHWLNYPLLFKYLATISTPVVWTLHDCWAFTGGCPYFELPPCDKWKTRCENCPAKHGKITQTAKHFADRQKLISGFGDRLTIVPVSRWLDRYVGESFLKDYRRVMIHNGVDTARFRVIGPKTKKPLVLGVANFWDCRKGLSDFFDLRKRLDPHNVQIALVGLSRSQIKSLPKGIYGVPKTQDIRKLVQLYNSAAVLANPTYADNFPSVNLEALACGTPVITYRTGGSPEAIDPDTGIVVDKGNVDAMANAILSVIDDPAKYTSATCRRRAETNFSNDLQSGQYLSLYTSLLHP